MPRSRARAFSQSVDDYLKAILGLGGGARLPVSSNALAARLGVRAASVTGMLQKLAAQAPALVRYRKHHGAALTAAGRRRAWELVRHHRLLERFLHDILHYPWDEVHDEAERLEHFISERFEDRIAAILDNPSLDPHGHAIPRKHGCGSFPDEVSLLRWPGGVPARISSVSDANPAALRAFERLGLLPGVAVQREAAPARGLLRLRRLGPKPVDLSLKRAWAQFIAVQRLPNSRRKKAVPA